MATTVNTRRRRFVTTMTAFLAVAVMSVAFAAWTADGVGTGNATSRTHQAVSIMGVADVADLYPGDTQDLDVTIDNSDNPYNVTVTSIAVATDDDVCNDPDLTLGSYTITGDSLVVEAGATATVALADAVAMGHDSTTDCQTKAWELDLSFTGFSSGETAVTPGSSLPKNP